MKIVGGNFWLIANYNLKSSLINKCVGFGFNGGLILAVAVSVAVVVTVVVAVTVAVVVAFLVVVAGDFSNSYKVQNKNENFKQVFFLKKKNWFC